MAGLTLSSVTAAELMAAARQAPNLEICGLIGRGPDGRDTVYAVANVATEPSRSFELAAADHIAAFKAMRQAGEQLLAVYHSHPDEAAIPSVADRSGLGYPSAYTLIVAPTQPEHCSIRAWQLTCHGFIETPLVLSS